LIFRGATEPGDAVWFSVVDITSTKSKKSAAVIKEKRAWHQDYVEQLVGISIIKILVMWRELYPNFVALAGVS
ncbi:hypothetical protein P3X46_002501, partial [Hevea brasiliensis]